VADIKGAAYFMDASQAGICRLPESAWLPGPRDPRTPSRGRSGGARRLPEADNMVRLDTDAVRAVADMRAAEIVAVLAGHIRCMGLQLGAYAGSCVLDLDMLAVLSGLVLRTGRHRNRISDSGFPLRQFPRTTNYP